MAYLLTSRLNTYMINENLERVPIALGNENEILDNIKRHLTATRKIVYVANNPSFIEENEMKSAVLFSSFEKAGIHFDTQIVLDDRNKKNAEKLLSSADLMILCGGKCLCQNNFFKEIGLKKILKNYKGLVIGISAGTMNLCKEVANFPEEISDLNEPRWLKGLNITDKIIIPHFDGETNTYQIECDEVDVVKDYIFPLSYEKDFLGIPNGSYVLIDNNGAESYFGDMYIISKGKVFKKRKK